MTMLPAASNNPNLWTPSTDLTHASRLAAVVERIEQAAESRLDGLTTLIPVIELQATVQAIEGRRGIPIGAQGAADAARMLLGMYPARQVNNADVFATALATLLAAYEGDFVKRVLNPVDGLPSRCKFLPTLAEVKEALEAEKARRGTIRAVAKWMLAEHARRKAEREEAERWKLSPEELERRRIRAEELTRPFKSERTET